MSIFLDQFVFLLAIAGLFFLPGILFLAAFFRARLPRISLFEYAIFSFALSLSLIDFGMIILSKAHIPLTQFSLFSFGSILILIPSFFLFPLFRKWWRHRKNTRERNERLPLTQSIPFSKKESMLLVGILVLTIFIKTVFLWNTILPTSTDLGHHMFWAKKIAIEGVIPEYEKIDIAFEDGTNTLTAPTPIDDFIIGEHLPFAAIALVTGLDFVSSFPSLFLLLVNIVSLIALSLLTYRLFEEIFPTKALARRGMIATLLFVGPLWALSSPEAKYVSGGVVGNLLGNFFIPIIILLLFRAFREKNASFLALAILFIGTLAFTHHLSLLVFLCVALFIGLFFILFNRKEAFPKISEWLKLFISPISLLSTTFLLFVIFFVYTPTYLDMNAIDTALGSPSKTTRQGLTFDQLAQSVGGARLGLELVGIALLLFSPLRKTLGSIVLLGWSLGLIIMTLFPHLVFLDIPSNRIGTYATFPAALLSAYALTRLFFTTRNASDQSVSRHQILFRASFALFLIATVGGGFFDNAGSLPKETNTKEAVQTYAVSSWLSKKTPPDEWILKDHNYLVADSWMKLFFMRDYSFPLSRGYFRRYTDEVTLREQCTLLMISAPNTPKGKACFESTGVRTVVVNPHVDSAQFGKVKDMSLLYVSDDVAVYKKTE